MSKLERETYHDCNPPTVEDRTKTHRWKCDDCQTEWFFTPWMTTPAPKIERYGFLGMRTRQIPREPRDCGRWDYRHLTRKPIWVEVES